MVDSASHLDLTPQLTPRQDRIEGAIVRGLISGATRSELRELVHQYSDLLRLQGVSHERIIAALKAVARRAVPRMQAREGSIAGDSLEDRMMLIVRWCSARLYRADDAERARAEDQPTV